MSNDLPPPYYASAAALQAEHRDIASLIRQLSTDIAKTDKQFYDVGAIFRGYPGVEVAPPDLKDTWATHRQSFMRLIAESKRAATAVEARNESFLDSILPLIGDDSRSKDANIDILEKFIAKAPPQFLTSMEGPNKCREINAIIPDLLKKYEENADKLVANAQAEIKRLEAGREKQREKEKVVPAKKGGRSWFGSSPVVTAPPPEHVDYDSMIAEQKENIEAVNKQRDNLKSKLADIRFALNTIPDQVGQSFWTVWNHLTNDATHLKNRLEGSTTDPMPDLPMVVRVYRQINDALKFYATNLN